MIVPLNEGMVGDFYFNDEDTVRGHLGTRIRRGELALVFGSGISRHAGFPLYKELVGKMRKMVSLDAMSEDADLKVAVDEVWESVLEAAQHADDASGQDARVIARTRYKDIIYQSLYPDDASAYERVLSASAELSYLSSLTVGSSASRVSQILTYNIDSYLEDYLMSQGIKCERISELPVLRRADVVQIYHPHGYISRHGSEWSRDFVLSGGEYTTRDWSPDVHHRAWRDKVGSMFYEQQGLFIGLSGADDDFGKALRQVYQQLKDVGIKERAYVGFWLHAGDLKKTTYDRVRYEFGCMPVKFKTHADMWRFVHSLRREI